MDRRISFPQILWSSDSARIAYATGGDSIGTEDDGPTALSVYDRTKDQVKTIVEHPVLSGDSRFEYRGLTFFSWLNDHTLLFARRSGGRRTQADVAERPAIYEADVRGSQTLQVVKNGYAPLPSPDGQWIAYLGWPQQTPASEKSGKSEKAETAPQDFDASQGLRVCLFNRKKKTSIPLELVRLGSTVRKSMGNLALRWSPDSKSLFVVSSHSERPLTRPRKESELSEMQGTSSIEIQVVKVVEAGNKDGYLRTAGSLNFTNYPAGWGSPIEVLRVSKDGKYLFLKKSQPDEKNREITQDTLLAVDLKTGKVEDMASYQPQDNLTKGWDWYEEP